MLKCMALLKRKAGVDRADFIDRYENRHVALIRKIFPEIIDFRRNYVDPAGPFLPPGAPAPDWDVVTEIRFADRVSFDRFLERASDPAVGSVIAEDEATIFDGSATRIFVVEEHD